MKYGPGPGSCPSDGILIGLATQHTGRVDMESMLSVLGGKLGSLLLGISGTLAIIPLARRFLPSLVAGKLRILIKRGLDPNTTDQELRKRIHDLVLAAVKLTEYLIPDAGSGPQRKAAVLTVLSRIMPGAPAVLLSELVEIAVSAMDNELKQASQPDAP